MNHRRHSSEQGVRRVQARENVSTTQVEHRSQEGSSLRPSVCRGGIISTRSQSLVPLWDVSPIRKIRQGRQCDQRGEGQIKLGCAIGVANCGVALLGRDYVTTSTKSRAHGVVASHPLRMRKALGSNPSVSNLHLDCLFEIVASARGLVATHSLRMRKTLRATLSVSRIDVWTKA